MFEIGLNPDLFLSHCEFHVYVNGREISRRGIVRKNLPQRLLPIVRTNIIENIGIKLQTTMKVYISICATVQ